MKGLGGAMRRPGIVDFIESFMDGKIGEQKKVLITQGRSPTTIHDTILWKAGKRAFDTVNSSYDGHITKEDIYNFFHKGKEDLIDLWNSYESEFQPLISKGILQIIPVGSQEPIQNFTPLSSSSVQLSECYELEPYIRTIDAVYESSNIRSGLDQWPFHRELVGSFFTLFYVEFFAAGAWMERVDEQDYALVTYWFERIDLFEQKKAAIKEQQAFLKKQKSKSMNNRRHAKGNEARKLVTDDWNRNRCSAAKAGVQYAQWLEEKGYKFEPDTITKWIRQYAKENGIKLR